MYDRADMMNFSFEQFSTQNQQLKSGAIKDGWVIDGEPKVMSRTLSTSQDGEAFIAIWECTTGKFRWEYAYDETIYFVEGCVTFEESGKPPRTAKAGDVVYFPKGASVIWQVHSPVRKIAVCRKVLPGPLRYMVRMLRLVKNTATGSTEGVALLAALAHPVMSAWSMDLKLLQVLS
jgi:uncharacterized protein